MTASPDLILAGLSPAPPGPDQDAGDDARLVALSRTEPERFTEIFDRHFGTVHGYIARRLGTDVADDLSSETFLIAFRQRARFDARAGAVRAWLFGIATNLIRRHRRDEVRGWRAAARVPREPAGGHDDQVAAKVTAQGVSSQLADALARLSAKDREVLMLVALGQLSYEEVAAALDVPYGTVCSRLARARRVVREALAPIHPNLKDTLS
jgi:RNA polymerase sigma-70 factor (ECF subfamily)